MLRKHFDEVTIVPKWNAVHSTQNTSKLTPTLYAGSAEFAALVAGLVRNGWAGTATHVQRQRFRQTSSNIPLAPQLLNADGSGPDGATVG